jgi:hypothetical protein
LQGPPPDPVVAQDAIAITARRDVTRRLQAKLLEGGAIFGTVSRHLLQLCAMVEGKDPQGGPVARTCAAAGCCPVDLFQFAVATQIGPHHPARQKIVQLGQRGIGGGTAVTADGKGAAGIGIGQGRRPVGVFEPAFQQTGEETVPRAQHVEYLDRETGAGLACLQIIGDGPHECNRAAGSALADQRGRGQLADFPQSRDGVGAAASDVEFLFGSHDQIEQRQRCLQPVRDPGAFDEPAFPIAMSGHPPEVRAIVDIQRRPRTMTPRHAQRLQDRGFGSRMGQMRSGGQNGTRAGNEIFVDIGLGQGHIGAVLAIEDQRKATVVADAQQNQRGQAVRIGCHTAHVHALALQLFADEAAHMLIPDPCDHGRFQTQPRGATGNVGGRSADIFRERAHVFQPAADLLAVKIDRGPADRDHVKRLHVLPRECAQVPSVVRSLGIHASFHTVPPSEPSSCAIS